MPSKKTKTAAVAVPVPVDRDDCARRITQLGQLMRQQALQKAGLDGKIAELTDQYAPVLAGLQQQIDALHQGIQIWCEGHRSALTQGGKVKTANLITGDVVWRQRPPSVTIRQAELVIQRLKDLGLRDYVRTSEEVNKTALLDMDAAASRLTDDDLEAGDSEASQARAALAARFKLHASLIKGVQGITINKGVEDFSVVPFETEAVAAGVAA
jgi:phage host-nuclease inhibitor protein Gam